MKNKLYLATLLLCISSLGWAESNTTEVREAGLTELDKAELDMTDLLKTQVTSVSKKAQALSDAAAAVFVISNEDIKRAGVTSVPDALRMAPGIDVARINSSKWAITSRGFNGSLANKLLVLIDGRSVYSPAFSGVYWDAQDVMLEDVDRIEVIRGPGATLWGANAVNGVINIISKRAEQTTNGLLVGGAGTLETGFGALRYGKKLAENTYGRSYIKGFERNNNQNANNLVDSWNKKQGGFRVDSLLSNQDELIVQGDIYHTTLNQSLVTPIFSAPYQQNLNDKATSEGWNVTSRLKHKFSTTAEYTLQLYYDHTKRNEFYSKKKLDTFDVDFQNSFELNEQHNIIWGLGYRVNLDKFSTDTIVLITPRQRNTQLFTAFVQDEITLIDNALLFTIGSKFEHNDYTGFEGQPSARLIWTPSPSQRIWTAFSRAVRTPARDEQDARILEAVVRRPTIPIPIAVTLNGSKNYHSEVQLSYELGYRFTFNQKTSLDITGFYNDYSRLRQFNSGATFLNGSAPAIYLEHAIDTTNLGRAHAYGIEAAASWQMQDWWRWDVSYSYLTTHIHDFQANPTAISPKHKVSLRAILNPIKNVNLDFWLRYNGLATAFTPLNMQSSTKPIHDYLNLDIRLAWKLHPSVELSLVGQNLLATRHSEYVDEAFTQPSTIPRAVYGNVAFDF